MAELVNQAVGKEGNVTVTLTNEGLVIEAKADTKLVDASLKVVVGVDALLDMIAAKIPGTFDDKLIALAKVALKA